MVGTLRFAHPTICVYATISRALLRGLMRRHRLRVRRNRCNVRPPDLLGSTHRALAALPAIKTAAAWVYQTTLADVKAGPVRVAENGGLRASHRCVGAVRPDRVELFESLACTAR
jgi:hypothetical protein